jgi:antibiotic biosynthesis monooxygenase (ABM) superfamily enzyme
MKDENEIKEIKMRQRNTNNKVYNVVLKASMHASLHYLEEKWLSNLIDKILVFDGYSYHHINMVKREDVITYVITIAFDSLENCRSWITSSDYEDVKRFAENNGIIIHNLNEFGGGENTTKITIHDTMDDCPQAPPPPVWKIFLIIWFGVFLVVCLIRFSGIETLMALSGIPLYFIILLSLSHSVTILTYTFFPLFMSIKWISDWLKLPRRDKREMCAIESILDGGLSIFKSDTTYEELYKKMSKRMNKIEANLKFLKELNFRLQNELTSIHHDTPHHNNITHSNTCKNEETVELGLSSNSLEIHETITDTRYGDIVNETVKLAKQKSAMSHDVPPVISPIKERRRSSGNKYTHSYSSLMGILDSGTSRRHSNIPNQPLTLSVVNRVKWECTVQYEDWLSRMNKEMSRY